jgi:menaquinone-dependent protoporphyrinogen oxidase
MGCLTMAAAGLTICGAGLAVPIPDPGVIDTPSTTHGENNMNRRVLVAYASGLGSTVEVADEIGKTLGAHGFYVDVKPIQKNLAIDGYQSVIIGSAVRHGEWLPEAVAFVRNHQASLTGIQVALFCVHIANLGNDESRRRNRLAYLEEVRTLLNPVDEAFFAGKFDRRGAALLLPGWLARLIPTMDLRKWKKIRSWADSIVPQLSVQTSI